MATQRGRSKKKAAGAESLNITSMMDMFTIILLFLLKSFSADGSILTNADNLVLPNSISKKKPKDVNLQLAVTQDMILVDNSPIVDFKSISEKDQLEFDEDTTSLLDKELKKHMNAEIEMVRIGLLNEVKGNIIVQVDKNINFDMLYKVMRICGRNGYINMKFAVMMREG
jgi:biopolymer transport protein ExbD